MSAESVAKDTRNDINLEDDLWFALPEFVLLSASVVFVLYRVSILAILRQNVNKGSKGWVIKMVMSFFPMFFAIIQVIQLLNHELNNACRLFTPLSYLLRFMIHTVVFTYQLLALLLIKTDSFLLQKPTWFLYGAFGLLCLPTFVYVVLLYVFGLGVPLSGLCTIGLEDGSDLIDQIDISYWLIIATVFEIVFVDANAWAGYTLGKTVLPPTVKAELQALNKWSTFYIIFDILFRFKGIQTILALPFDRTLNIEAAKQDDTYVLLDKIYSVTFAIVYIGGMSTFLAYSLEKVHVEFFGYSYFNPFKPRFWRQLFGTEHVSPVLLEKFSDFKLRVRREARVTGGNVTDATIRSAGRASMGSRNKPRRPSLGALRAGSNNPDYTGGTLTQVPAVPNDDDALFDTSYAPLAADGGASAGDYNPTAPTSPTALPVVVSDPYTQLPPEDDDPHVMPSAHLMTSPAPADPYTQLPPEDDDPYARPYAHEQPQRQRRPERSRPGRSHSAGLPKRGRRPRRGGSRGGGHRG